MPPEPIIKAENPIIAKTGDPHIIAWEGGAMGDKPDEVTKQPESKTKTITRIYPLSEGEDDAMHRAVDGHGKGFFTLNEFLRYLGETKTPEMVDYFNKYTRHCYLGSCESSRFD